MSDFEKKYYDLLEKVADLRKKQKSYERCKTSNDRVLANNAARKIDDLITQEVGKIVKIQTKMF